MVHFKLATTFIIKGIEEKFDANCGIPPESLVVRLEKSIKKIKSIRTYSEMFDSISFKVVNIRKFLMECYDHASPQGYTRKSLKAKPGNIGGFYQSLSENFLKGALTTPRDVEKLVPNYDDMRSKNMAQVVPVGPNVVEYIKFVTPEGECCVHRKFFASRRMFDFIRTSIPVPLLLVAPHDHWLGIMADVIYLHLCFYGGVRFCGAAGLSEVDETRCVPAYVMGMRWSRYARSLRECCKLRELPVPELGNLEILELSEGLCLVETQTPGFCLMDRGIESHTISQDEKPGEIVKIYGVKIVPPVFCHGQFSKK
jgi:hypothetical protein